MRNKLTESLLLLITGLAIAVITFIFSACSAGNPVNYQRSVDLRCGGDLECLYLSGERWATDQQIAEGKQATEPPVVFIGSLCPDSVVSFLCNSPDALSALPAVDRWLSANRTGVNVPDAERELIELMK